MFEHRTISKISNQLQEKLQRIEPQNLKQNLPLSYAQQRMLFIEQFEGGSSAYHIPFVLPLEKYSRYSKN